MFANFLRFTQFNVTLDLLLPTQGRTKLLYYGFLGSPVLYFFIQNYVHGVCIDVLLLIKHFQLIVQLIQSPGARQHLFVPLFQLLVSLLDLLCPDFGVFLHGNHELGVYFVLCLLELLQLLHVEFFPPVRGDQRKLNLRFLDVKVVFYFFKFFVCDVELGSDVE